MKFRSGMFFLFILNLIQEYFLVSKKVILHQVLAIADSRSNAARHLTSESHKHFNNSSIFDGMVREYEPLSTGDENIDQFNKDFPTEKSEIGANMRQRFAYLFDKLGQFINAELTKETLNQQAKADIMVNGEVLYKDCPVQGLLFLEKRFKEVRGLIAAAPTLDNKIKWEYNENEFFHSSPVTDKAREEKRRHPIIIAEPTPQHPVKYEMQESTVVVGTWKTQLFSARITVAEKAYMLSRVDELLEAISSARHEANTLEGEFVEVGSKLFEYVLGGLKYEIPPISEIE